MCGSAVSEDREIAPKEVSASHMVCRSLTVFFKPTMGRLPMWPTPAFTLTGYVVEQADKAVINLLEDEEEEEGAAGDENEDREVVTIPSPVPANESDPASSAGEAMNPFASFTYSADDPGNGKLFGTETSKPVAASGTHVRMHPHPCRGGK